MAIQIFQRPDVLQPCQSPIAFSVYSEAFRSSSFVYSAKVWAWTGSSATSGSSKWTIQKYPNELGVGIFDLSRVLSSELDSLAIQNSSSVVWYSVEFAEQWYSASGTANILMSGSTAYTDGYLTYDGYNTYPQGVNYSPTSASQWPLMTSMTTVTQSVSTSDRGYIGVWNDGSVIEYIGTYENGTTDTQVIDTSTLPNSLSGEKVVWIPGYPSETGFPLSTVGLTGYTVGIGSNVMNVKVDCNTKWNGWTIQWKNRYGQFDHLWMSGPKRSSFNTDQRVYQPQLGSWTSPTLAYNTKQGRSQRYIVDSNEKITLNSGWLDEGWNALIKELMVSDEIYYWDGDWYPMSIDTNAIEFKTRANDKLIQYTIGFNIGSNFKQIF